MPHRRSWTSAVAVAATAALAVAGCGGDGGGEQTAAEAEAVATVEVVETDFAIEPTDASVEEAGPVELQVSNEGETTHSLAIEAPDEEFVSDEIAPGDSTSFTADLPSGEHVWYCPIANHRELGMEGTITVGGGAAGADSGGSEDGGSDAEDGAASGAPY